MFPTLPPPEMILDALKTMVAPAVVGSAVPAALLLIAFGKRAAYPAVAIGLIAGLCAANAISPTLPWKPEWKPETPGWHWLLYAAAGASVVGIIARWSALPAAVSWAPKIAAAGCATWLLVPAEMRQEKRWVSPAFAACVLVIWSTVEALGRRKLGAVLPLAFAILFGSAAAVLIHAHCATFMQVGANAFAALAGIAIVALCCRIDAGGIAPACAVLLPGLMLAGLDSTFSDVPLLSYLLIALAPLALVRLLIAPYPAVLASRGGSSVLFEMVLIPALIAVILAMQAEELSFG